MKKIIVLMLSLLLVLSMAACPLALVTLNTDKKPDIFMTHT